MSPRSQRPIIQFVGNLAKVAIPLALIAAAAIWVLNRQSTQVGELRVITTVKGAEIHIDGKQTGALTDTVLLDVPVGRRLVTVRATGKVSEPEVAIVEVQKGRPGVASFVMHDSAFVVTRDTISARRGVRQDIFADAGGAVRSIPAAPGRRSLLDYSERTSSSLADKQSSIPVPRTSGGSSQPEMQDLPFEDTLRDEIPRSLSGTQITVTSEPAGASIVVNGARTTSKTPYTFRGLDRGYYVFSVEQLGQISTPDSIEIALSSDGQSELAAFSLQPAGNLPAPQLVLSTKPLAAPIRVNGTSVGVGSARLSAEYGNVLVEFSAVPGYRTPDPVRLSITKDEPNHEVVGTYERLSGTALLAVVPSETFQRFEASKLRVFVDGELILDAPSGDFDATLLGSLHAGERSVKVEYDGLSAEELVKFSDDHVAEATLRINAAFGKRSLKLKMRTNIPIDTWQARHKKSVVLTQS